MPSTIPRVAVLAMIALGCGGAEVAASASAPRAPASAPPPAPTLLFAVAVPLGEESQRLYVVIDETRDAGAAADGEPTELGNDGLVAASIRPVDLSRLEPSHRSLAPSRFVALGADCAGTLGPVVELTLRSEISDDPDYSVTALAAPLEPACEMDAMAVHLEGAPPARAYHGTDVELDEPARAEVLTAMRALPEYTEAQTELEGEYGEPLSVPWDEELGHLPQFVVYGDGEGRELVHVWVGGRDRPLTALFERVGDRYVVRAVEPGSLVLDLEGDGVIETIDRLGLLRMRTRVRSFARRPYVLGC